MMKTVPPLNDLFSMAGLSLPEYLAKTKDEPQKVIETKVEEVKKEEPPKPQNPEEQA